MLQGAQLTLQEREMKQRKPRMTRLPGGASEA